jgi:hypothetical protein
MSFRHAPLLLCVGLVGCGPVGLLAAANRSTSQFVASPSDARVFYEPGAEVMAREVTLAMPSAVAIVEDRMFGPFTVPVRVYVCATIDSLTSYGASARAGGFTTNHRVFISPKPENTAERIPRLLVHELSHLHLGQRRGLLSFAALPVWFTEGVAVDVSSGAGAEGVTEVDAWQAITRGHALVPDTDGSVWHRRGASAFGLEEHMFYRQAGMFISYLRSIDRARFRAFLAAVEDGDPMDSAFRGAYGASVDTVWRRFGAERVAQPDPP